MFCAYVVLGLCNVSFHMESVLKFFNSVRGTIKCGKVFAVSQIFYIFAPMKYYAHIVCAYEIIIERKWEMSVLKR